jgi:hypothetical protein
MKHRPEVFIIESLELDDEDMERTEGQFLSHILRLDDKHPRYRYIRSLYDLKKTLKEFDDCGYRYLHFSSHGDKSSIKTTFDRIDFRTFGNVVRGHLVEKRLFVSACKATNEDLAKEIFRNPGCISLIGPQRSPYFGQAAVFWASFYHTMFEINEHRMIKDDIKPTLLALKSLFKLRLNYFTRNDNEVGFVPVKLDC